LVSSAHSASVFIPCHEIDGGYFGGYVKPANRIENRRDRRLRQNQSGKRKVVVVIRERDGKTLPGVFASEVAALNFIRTRIARGRQSTPTKPGHGTSFMAGSRCTGSTIKRLTASTAISTRITPSRFSQG
jgi:hypothetical protein